MKNAILSYVYNVIPEEEKEIIQAMDLAEKDEKNRESQNSDSSSQVENKKTDVSSGENAEKSTSAQNDIPKNENPTDITNVTDPLNLPAIEEDF